MARGLIRAALEAGWQETPPAEGDLHWAVPLFQRIDELERMEAEGFPYDGTVCALEAVFREVGRLHRGLARMRGDG